jgi:hypothetical protein
MRRFVRLRDGRILGLNLGDWFLLVGGFIAAGVLAGLLGHLF